MDIMDSTDTPTGGLDGTTASSYSSSSALPLSVDQRDDFASPTNRTTIGGNQPTSSSFGFSSGGSAFDRLDATPAFSDEVPDMPTSLDDVMMPRIDFVSHPSITSGTTTVDTSSPSQPLTQQAKDKANAALETAKDKAADARTKAAEVTDSAKEKAVELKDSAKVKAAHLANKVEDTAESLKDKLVLGAEKVKEEGKHLLVSAKSTLHSAEQTVEDKYEHIRADMTAKRAEANANAANAASKPTAPLVKSTATAEPTDTPAGASTMRDVHLHPGLASWASHGNEIPTKETETHMTDAHHRALVAGEEAHARAVAQHADDKDVSANPIQGWSVLQKVHDKIEDGAEAVKERVDGFLERNVRTDDSHHMSAAKKDDIPTLIDTSNTHNTSMVRAKMHPSAERTLSGHDQDD